MAHSPGESLWAKLKAKSLVERNGVVTSPRVRQAGLKGGSREPDRVARDKEAVKALDPERAANNGPVKAGLTLADHVLTVTGARGLMEVVEPEKAQKAVTGVAEVAGVE